MNLVNRWARIWFKDGSSKLWKCSKIEVCQHKATVIGPAQEPIAEIIRDVFAYYEFIDEKEAMELQETQLLETLNEKQAAKPFRGI